VSESTIWWVLAGVAVAVELVTGTFYLLMLAIGMAAGAVAAHLGLQTEIQLLIGAVVSAATVGGWHLLRARRPADLPATANRDVNLDIGETVQVDAWNADGTATVRYRGASWTVVAAQDVHVPGRHRVREVSGNRLVVEKI
jgi:membrane protein implicated in regulation of membrane protease activity